MNNRRILIMTAVEVEREAVLRGLAGANGFDVALAGVGPASAAARTAKAIGDRMAAGTNGVAGTEGAEYRLVISAGIGGGFADRAEIGSVVVADAIIAPDLGAETQEGYRSVDELGFGSSRIDVDCGLVDRVAEGIAGAGLAVTTGPVLTVTTVTGSAETAAALVERVPSAAAEAMEGYGVAMAASLYGLPALEVRAISNAVGPRDRAAWRIKDALQALEAASHTLAEVLR